MTTIKYNYLIATLIIIFSFFFHNVADAQVSNDDRFHYELYIGFVQPLINEDLVNTDEWVAKFNFQTDINNSASTLASIDACGPIFRVDPGETAIGPDTNDDGIIDGRANVTIPPVLDQNENNDGKKAIDINMRVFEEDTRGTGSGCSGGDINHDDTAKALLTIDEASVDNFASGQNFAGAVTLNTSGANTAVAYAWRYARGEFNTPLDFGVLPFNFVRTHLNSNRIKPVLSPSNTSLGIHHAGLNYPNLIVGNFNNNAGEVYYKFSIDARSNVSISTSQNTQNTLLKLFGSSPNPILEFNNDLGTIELEAGEYTIVVDGYNGGSLFNLSVLREHLPEPANTSCATPVFLTVDDANCSTTFYNSLGATQGIGACAPATFAEDAVFFAFTATSSDMTIDITGDSGFDPVFQVYQQTQSGCFGVTIASCVNDNSIEGGTESFSSDVFIVGERYNIRVYDAQDGPEGEQSFTICVSTTPNPAETCSFSIPLTCDVTVSGDNTGLSVSASAPNCFVANNRAFFHRGQWYSFTGNGSTVTLTLSNKNFNSIIFLYTGPCDDLVCESLVVGSSVIYHTNPGTDYKILIAGNDTNEFGSFDLTMTCRDESEICSNGYVGENKLVDDQYIPMEFRTNGSIESEQSIVRSGHVLYAAGTSSTSNVNLLPGFSVTKGRVFTVDFTGCNTTN